MNVLKAVLIVSLLAVAAYAAAVTYGRKSWDDGTRRLRACLDRARLPMMPQVVDFRELEGLPQPAQRYFRTTLEEGRPMVTGVRMKHQGVLNMGEKADRWRPFVSDQRVTTRPPGFDWDARVRMMPGLTVHVRDAYVAGEGVLSAALFGLVRVADRRGAGDIAEGELMRFLAEAAWYPTMLLPSQGVRWEAIGARTARAALAHEATVVTLVFTFHDFGGIETVTAEARGRTVGTKIVPTPWRGRFWNYQERGGMRVPLEAEVSWVFPDGPKAYWRGRLTEIDYEFAV